MASQVTANHIISLLIPSWSHLNSIFVNHKSSLDFCCHHFPPILGTENRKYGYS